MASASNTPRLTKAGAKLLEQFVQLERLGHLTALVDGLRNPAGNGMSLRPGDGAQLATAQKLSRDGFARLVGGRRNMDRYVIITDAGRAALDDARENERHANYTLAALAACGGMA